MTGSAVSDGRCVWDPEDYSIAREGVWGREGLAAAADDRPADDGKRVYEMDVLNLAGSFV